MAVLLFCYLDASPLADIKSEAEDFIISYKIILKDNVPFGEKYSVSEALTRFEDFYKYNYSCVINISNKKQLQNDRKTLYLLKESKDEVLTCLYKNGVLLDEDTISYNNVIKTHIKLLVPPTRLKVYNNGSFLELKIYKKGSDEGR